MLKENKDHTYSRKNLHVTSYAMIVEIMLETRTINAFSME